MKNSGIVSALIGGTFFAIPYLALSVGIIPSLAIGAAAFGAGELMLSDKKKTLEYTNRPLYETLVDAKKQNKEIKDIIPNIENVEIRDELKEINMTVDTIINAIERNPKKEKQINNFFTYYLPVALKIVKKYDDIENQRLSSKEGKDFMKNSEKMIKEINSSFKKQLSNLYQSEMIDGDAEMKLFDSMLKADGIESKDFNLKKNEEENHE